MSIKKQLFPVSILIMSLLLLISCNQSTDIPVVENTQAIVDPIVPDHSIFRPTIELKTDLVHAGTAFALEFGDNKTPIILSAIHLMGPHGGLEKNIPSSEIPKVLISMSLSDAFNGDSCGTITKALSIPGAKPSSLNKDVMAFLPEKDLNIYKYKLCDEMPKKGEYVWLAAKVNGGAPESQKLHRAIVVSVSSSKLSYKYDNSELELDGTSGAPIINKDGKVVGINISLKKQGKNLIGLANPSSSFQKMLIKALEK